MTRFYKSLWFVFVAIFALSCSDDDSLPLPTAAFEVQPAEIEVGVPVMFDNLSINAARYEWDFGDGLDPITDISPSVTFTTPGSVTVTLKAFTADEQFVETSQEITVKERILTGIFVNIYPETNADAAWDPDETGVDSLADIIVQLLPADSPEDDQVVVAGPFNNLTAPFSISINPDNNRIVLTDEEWRFVIIDFDGEDIANATNDDFVTISGVEFDQLQAPTVKNDEGDAGFISLRVVNQAVQGLLDVDLTFRLE